MVVESCAGEDSPFKTAALTLFLFVLLCNRNDSGFLLFS